MSKTYLYFNIMLHLFNKAAHCLKNTYATYSQLLERVKKWLNPILEENSSQYNLLYRLSTPIESPLLHGFLLFRNKKKPPKVAGPDLALRMSNNVAKNMTAQEKLLIIET